MAITAKHTTGRGLGSILLAVQAFFWATIAQAQDIQVDINPQEGGGGAWYTAWWVWVLVGLFVIVIVVALTSRGKSSA
jgi:uncharacterized membrane protein